MSKWIVPLFALAACGDNLAPPETPPEDMPHPPWAEAPHGTPPTLVSLGGPVLTAPRVQPIFFAGDETMQAAIDDFAKQLAVSNYWHETTAEYGVGLLTALPSIVTHDPVPTTDAELVTFLTTHLDGTHTAQGFPATVDPQTIYSIFTPQGVVVHGDQGDSCDSYGAYHDEAMGTHGESIVYAFMPRCADQNDLTIGTSHEWIEAATDPLVETDLAYGDADPDNYVMAITPGAETGDYCEYLETAYVKAVGDYMVQRTWSNAASLAGKDPCVPAPSTPYIAAVPMWTDQVPISGFNGSVKTRGAKVPVGMTATVDVQVISDVPTQEFDIKATDTAMLYGQPTEVTMTLDKSTGKNGDVLHMTIKRVRAGQLPGSEIVIEATPKGGRTSTSMWFGYVD